jgi:CBS domain-containing protein
MIVTGNLSDVLARKDDTVWTIAPDATVFEAIELMAERNIGALLVMADGKLLGVLSERDYTRKVALKGRSSKDTFVREILAPPVAVTRADTVEHAMKLMTGNRVRHLAVLDGAEVAGVVSIGDLVNWIIQAQDAAIHQLEGYISGHYSV